MQHPCFPTDIARARGEGSTGRSCRPSSTVHTDATRLRAAVMPFRALSITLSGSCLGAGSAEGMLSGWPAHLKASSAAAQCASASNLALFSACRSDLSLSALQSRDGDVDLKCKYAVSSRRRVHIEVWSGFGTIGCGPDT